MSNRELTSTNDPSPHQLVGRGNPHLHPPIHLVRTSALLCHITTPRQETPAISAIIIND